MFELQENWNYRKIRIRERFELQEDWNYKKCELKKFELAKVYYIKNSRFRLFWMCVICIYHGLFVSLSLLFFLLAASKSTIHLTKLYIFSTRRRKWIRNSFAIYCEVLIQIPVILDWVIEAGEDELYNVTIQKSTRLKSFKGHATPFPVTTKRL